MEKYKNLRSELVKIGSCASEIRYDNFREPQENSETILLSGNIVLSKAFTLNCMNSQLLFTNLSAHKSSDLLLLCLL